jgi:DNA-binding IscR family transcriptional regulator
VSDKAKAIVWDYYQPKEWGAPIITVSALADAANDHGGGISTSIPELAEKTRQSDRAVQKQLRRLEQTGLLSCVEKTVGGAGYTNQYQINLALMVAEKKGEPGSPLTVNGVHPYLVNNPEPRSPLSERTNKEVLQDLFVEDVSTFTLSQGAEDRRLAEWMLKGLRALNPKHGEPSWQTWCRDIRLMRDREKRTRREIAELFAWANADPFWQANILSPGTLRRQWDKLEIQRMRKGGNGRGGQAASTALDKSCYRLKNGDRCGKPGEFSISAHPDAPWVCRECNLEIEQERAGGQA